MLKPRMALAGQWAEEERKAIEEFVVKAVALGHGVCGLCDETKLLRQSHIVPAFVIRYLKYRPGPTPSRLLRRTPDKTNELDMVQDGDKLPLFCGACEQKIGRWEKAFKEHFFIPFHNAPTFRSTYGPWMALFCASLVWRILSAATDRGTYVQVPSAHLVEPTIKAHAVWKRFLNGELKSPGLHELHLIPLNTGGVDSDTLSYIEWTIDTKIMGSPRRRDLWVFAKLIGFVIVGIIYDPDPKSWRHTKIYPGTGTWGGDVEYWAPESVERYLKTSVKEGGPLTRAFQERNASRKGRRRGA